ncbi:uncharacterized protein V1510DRAFT_425581 [Dipodascopsis tothii]|uniref:uncharacterized protein n=1 Tax=Dipodascopsis tothii TaxID=44089 RepID=UPI0034CFE784
MPLPNLPTWAASQLGLGVTSALILGYRSYERVHYIFVVKFNGLWQTFFTRAPGLYVAGDDERVPSYAEAMTARPAFGAELAPVFAARDSADGPAPAYSRLSLADQIGQLAEQRGTVEFFLRAQPDSDRQVINIYNNLGEKIYVIARQDRKSQTWTLAYAEADGDGPSDLATIYAGKKDSAAAGAGIISSRAQPGKYILFTNPAGGLIYRKVMKQWTPEDGNLRTFYLAGAEPYHWTKNGLLQKSVFTSAQVFLSDPAIWSPATMPVLGAPASRARWGGRSSASSVVDIPPARALAVDTSAASTAANTARNRHVSGALSRASSPTTPTTLAAAAPWAAADAAAAPGRETIACATKIARGMTWRVLVNTSKINPETVLATAWISILHQWPSRVTSLGRSIRFPDVADQS